MSDSDIVHPRPTDATIRELYAHAFTCAHPECGEWLYKPGKGKPVLNSRVSHIHARRARGPRWKPGMSADENRAATNLLVLCIPHSYEIDDHQDRYPAELLQEWRAAQREQHEQVLKGWPLTEPEVREITAQSFTPAADQSRVLSGTVRAGESLAQALEVSRGAVVAQAEAWSAEWAHFSIPVGYDLDGERAFAHPSPPEVQRQRAAMASVLGAAQASVQPAFSQLKTELAVTAAEVPTAAPWCQWVGWAAESAYRAAGSWPGPPPVGDDAALGTAIDEVRRAVRALAGHLRGDATAEPPPERPSHTVPPVTSDEPDPVLLHRQLLERARPFARVDHHPFDAELFYELVVAAQAAAGVPPVASASDMDLRATAGLAAAVAGNASEAELHELVSEHRAIRPICVSIHLLRALYFQAEEKGITGIRQSVRDALLGELDSLDWADTETWSGNEMYGRDVFSLEASLTSAAGVKDKLSQALTQNPTVIEGVLLAGSVWTEHLGHQEGPRFQRRYRELPVWFPTDALVAAAAIRYPGVGPAKDVHDDRLKEEVPRLLSVVLRLLSAL